VSRDTLAQHSEAEGGGREVGGEGEDEEEEEEEEGEGGGEGGRAKGEAEAEKRESQVRGWGGICSCSKGGCG